MSKLKPYPVYKDSGVEWIGEVPEDWKIMKFKRVFEFHNGNGFPHNYQGNTIGDVPFLKVSDISFQGKYVNKGTNYVSYELIDEKKWHIVESESILTAKIGEALRKNHRKISLQPCLIDNNMMALSILNEYNVDFLYYVLLVIDFDWFSNPGAVPSINNRYLREDFIALPTTIEQKKISLFLEEKTSEIDSLISDKKNLIELLEEKRQAIITETVTKGLDPNIKMKDSGIEWIGEIPEHWDVVKLKHVAMLRNKKSNKNLPYLGLENVEGKTGQIIEFNTSSNIEGESLEFFEGDILFGKLRPYLRKCIVAPQEGRCTSEFLVLKSNTDILCPEYLKSIMLSNDYIENINSSTYGAKMPRASWGFIGNVKIPLPSYSEQMKMMKEVDHVTKNIDELQRKLNFQITKLKDYRESLIYEAVTGKIDLRSC